jgi:hypothetical protein
VVLIRSALSNLDSFLSPIEARTVCRLPTTNVSAAIHVEVFRHGPSRLSANPSKTDLAILILRRSKSEFRR